jgi:hypothetical protein
LCVRGVDTFATAVSGLHPDLVGADRRLDTAAFRALSDHAVQAERYVEQASAGPALPQRMGRERIPPTPQAADADDREDPGPRWRPITPPTVECNGDEAFARVRLSTVNSHRPTPR